MTEFSIAHQSEPRILLIPDADTWAQVQDTVRDTQGVSAAYYGAGPDGISEHATLLYLGRTMPEDASPEEENWRRGLLRSAFRLGGGVVVLYEYRVGGFEAFDRRSFASAVQ